MFIIILGLCGFKTSMKSSTEKTLSPPLNIELVVLGVAQDGGAPHINCNKSYCKHLRNTGQRDQVVSLGLIDHNEKKCWIFEATPDFTDQRETLLDMVNDSTKKQIDGIFLSHAHIGHYTGLMYLGKEAMNAKGVKTYCMPRMKAFLENNGPWDQLVKLKNIDIDEINEGEVLLLSDHIKVMLFTVPHRDEYSETAGFKIEIGATSILFIPDINKWHVWDEDIKELVKTSDLSFLDATFYNNQEVNGRDLSEIPHPFVVESMDLFNDLDSNHRSHVYFIHMNHSNPMLDTNSIATKTVLDSGFSIARKGMRFNY